MKIVQLLQGSPEWAAWRASRFGSSEAAAMLGLSPYTTRSELLRLKHTGLDREFSDWFQRNVLDKGHAVEAGTRPKIEAQIGDDLYAVVCEGEGRLAASCDGLDLDGALAWECKQWAEELAAEVAAGRVPDTHMPQCQHILMVTGARRLLFTVSDGADRIVTAEVLPSPEWFQRLRDGWAQFERDLAAYVPPASAAPAATGRAPEALPALRIEVTGAVTASNLAEFKATALGAIRSVNRELRTDQDFADAEKAVKWCADVEARLKAAKDHALSQTADIDALFKALDEIADEARRVRLDVDKLVKRRKDEVREQAVTAARRALDQHIAALQAELAPMRLQPVPADFAGAIKGLRSIASMQDALDTTLANAKIAADQQARVIRGNVAAFKAATGDDTALQALFADLGQLVHEAPDVFVLRVQARIDGHRQAEAAKEAARQAAEAARIAAAEQRAREQAQREAEARIAEQQRVERERQERVQREALQASEGAEVLTLPAVAGNAAPAPSVRTIVPPPAAPQWTVTAAAPAANEPATLKLGTICERLGFTVSAAFLADVLHIRAADTAGRAVLYRESQWPVICQQLQSHISAMGELYSPEKAA